eukprot:s234_g25.t1
MHPGLVTSTKREGTSASSHRGPKTGTATSTGVLPSHRAHAEHCQDEQDRAVGINASENATMLQLKTQCIDKIYDLSIADATDPVGFGKHGSKSYLELRQTDPQYCEWVQTTSQEGEANPRLHRLAQWLSRATTDSLTAPRVATKWKGRTSDVAPKTQMEHVTRSSASSSEVGTGSMKTEMMAEMMEAIQALRSEVADLQSERRGSRPRRENHVDTEMESIGSFEKVSLKKKK